MQRPPRESFQRTGQTYFVTSQTKDRRPFFRHERWVNLLLEVMETHRASSYLLHAYVLMPDHFHLILTPRHTLERAMQNIKGSFSFRAKRALNWNGDIWQPGFSDHRLRDAEDCERHLSYIYRNPIKSRLAADYPYLAVDLDPIPQRLKPFEGAEHHGGAKAPPLQNES